MESFSTTMMLHCSSHEYGQLVRRRKVFDLTVRIRSSCHSHVRTISGLNTFVLALVGVVPRSESEGRPMHGPCTGESSTQSSWSNQEEREHLPLRHEAYRVWCQAAASRHCVNHFVNHRHNDDAPPLVLVVTRGFLPRRAVRGDGWTWSQMLVFFFKLWSKAQSRDSEHLQRRWVQAYGGPSVLALLRQAKVVARTERGIEAGPALVAVPRMVLLRFLFCR